MAAKKTGAPARKKEKHMREEIPTPVSGIEAPKTARGKVWVRLRVGPPLQLMQISASEVTPEHILATSEEIATFAGEE